MTDILDLRAPRTVDREKARTLHIRGITILETAFEARTIRSLRRVLKAVSSSLGAVVAAAEDESGEAWTSFDDIAAINAGWAAEVDNELTPLLADTYAAGAQSAGLAVAGSPEIPEFVHDQAVEWMLGATNRLARVSNDVWSTVREELTTGMLGGESIDQLKRRVRESMFASEARARTVARTEVIGATNAGSFFQAKALGVSTKTWLATDDKRTRRTHDRAEGQEVGMDDLFEVGGALLRFPHDPSGPAKETVNCRCTMLFDDNGACMCVPGWAQAEAGEMLVAAASSNCACSETPNIVEGSADDVRMASQRRVGGLSTRANSDAAVGDALQAYSAYTGSGFVTMNAVARGLSADGRARMRLAQMDDAFKYAGVTNASDITVYRGVTGKHADLVKESAGKDMIEDSYLSTTSDAGIGKQFGTDSDLSSAVLSIKVPAGSHVLAGHHTENELILGRGTRLRVTSVKGNQVSAEVVSA